MKNWHKGNSINILVMFLLTVSLGYVAYLAFQVEQYLAFSVTALVAAICCRLCFDQLDRKLTTNRFYKENK